MNRSVYLKHSSDLYHLRFRKKEKTYDNKKKQTNKKPNSSFLPTRVQTT